MRIGISTSVIQRGRGGVGQYVFALVRALRTAADEDELVLFVLEDDLPLFAFADPGARLVPVSERFRPPASNILWHQVRLPRLARRLRLDVLHVPSYRRLLWPRPCPRVATIHDLAPYHVPHKYDPLRMFYARSVVRRLAARQEEVIAVSRTTARDLQRFFHLPPDRVSVVPNGLDHDRFHPGSPAAARAVASARLGTTRPFFLYTARLEHPGKNHVRLLDAFDRFRRHTVMDWHLVLAGSDWHGAAAIHERIRASPFRRCIHCLGFVPDDDLPRWYRAADAFVYPSHFEGFGLPPLEAMACGCPVIASTTPALIEVCGDAAERVDPLNTDEIQAALTRFAADEELRRRLRLAGLTRARRFDWRRTAEATLGVYRRAARAGRVPLRAPEWSPGHP